MIEERADTVPGFTMQSENFFLKFITGLQCGVSSKLLEYETDWYEVMEIILSRLQDEQENKEKFENIASRDLETWAKMQPGGDSLNLKIRVSLEEKRYFEPPAGSRKALRLIFNDRFSTQVLFHVRKKMFLRSLREISAVSVADSVFNEDTFDRLDTELPRHLIAEVRRAYHNCWTPRFFRSNVVRLPCPASCSCKNKVYNSYVANMVSNSALLPRPEPVIAPDPLAIEPVPAANNQDDDNSEDTNNKGPKKSVSRKSQRKKKTTVKRKTKKEDKSKECENCSTKTSVSTRSNCDGNKSEASSSQGSSQPGVLTGLKVKIKQLHIEIESLVMKVRGKKRKSEDRVESKRRKSLRLSALKESLKELSRGTKRLSSKEDIFEPRYTLRPFKKSKLSFNKNRSNLSETKGNKRSLRNQSIESSSARKKRRHS